MDKLDGGCEASPKITDCQSFDRCAPEHFVIVKTESRFRDIRDIGIVIVVVIIATVTTKGNQNEFNRN